MISLRIRQGTQLHFITHGVDKIHPFTRVYQYSVILCQGSSFSLTKIKLFRHDRVSKIWEEIVNKRSGSVDYGNVRTGSARLSPFKVL